MKRILFMLFLFLLGTSAFSQNDTTIYGLAHKSSPAEIYLAKINPATGVVSNISSAPIASAVSGSTTIDPVNKMFYFTQYGGTFSAVNLVTGNVISNPPVTNATYFEGFHFNCTDNTIYGLARNTSPPEIFLAKINPLTGVVTNISSSSLANNITGSATALDPQNKIFYFTTNSKFVGVSLETGNIVSSPSMSNSNGTFFEGFLYNRDDATIYGLARNGSPPEIYFAKINPATGIVTNISNASLASIIINGTAIDPVNRIFYFDKISFIAGWLHHGFCL